MTLDILPLLRSLLKDRAGHEYAVIEVACETIEQLRGWHAGWLKAETQYIAQIDKLEATLREVIEEVGCYTVDHEVIDRAEALLSLGETK